MAAPLEILEEAVCANYTSSKRLVVCLCDDSLDKIIDSQHPDAAVMHYVEIAKMVDWWTEGLLLPFISLTGIVGMSVCLFIFEGWRPGHEW